jgi:hypothetical protein
MTVSWPFDRGNQAFVYGESSLAHVLEPGGRDVGREEWTPTSGLVHDPVLLGRATISPADKSPATSLPPLYNV